MKIKRLLTLSLIKSKRGKIRRIKVVTMCNGRRKEKCHKRNLNM
jgi:hypothetical protein